MNPATDPTPADLADDLADLEFKDHDDGPLRIAYARELSMYFRAVLAAGGFEKYACEKVNFFCKFSGRVGVDGYSSVVKAGKETVWRRRDSTACLLR